MPPALRSNTDLVVLFRQNILNERKKLYDHYAGCFPSFECFESVFQQCTNNYECLVIDNRTQSNRLEDQVFWYKADLHGDFRVGAPEFWARNDEVFNRRYTEKEEEDYNPSFHRKGPTINVIRKRTR